MMRSTGRSGRRASRGVVIVERSGEVLGARPTPVIASLAWQPAESAGARRNGDRYRRAALVFTVWTVLGLITTLQRRFVYSPGGHAQSLWAIAAAEMPTWYVWAALTPGILWLAARHPLRPGMSPRLIAAYVGGWATCLALHAMAATAVARATGWRPPDLSVARQMGVVAVSWLPSSLLIYTAVVGVAHWSASSDRERARERQQAEMSGQVVRAELNALRMQLHPHFLFNTLNTIAILIRERQTTVAERLVTQLGDLLRQLLSGSAEHEAALAQDLAFLRAYLDIEQVRFGDRLAVRWRIADAALGAAVPVLLLQPLVENALRHGIAHVEESGVLEIGARVDAGVLRLWVWDNGPEAVGAQAGPAARGPATTGLGLSNTRKRLEQLYPGRSSVHLWREPGGGTRADVTIPFRIWTAGRLAGSGALDRACSA